MLQGVLIEGASDSCIDLGLTGIDLTERSYLYSAFQRNLIYPRPDSCIFLSYTLSIVISCKCLLLQLPNMLTPLAPHTLVITGLCIVSLLDIADTISNGL